MAQYLRSRGLILSWPVVLTISRVHSIRSTCRAVTDREVVTLSISWGTTGAGRSRSPTFILLAKRLASCDALFLLLVAVDLSGLVTGGTAWKWFLFCYSRTRLHHVLLPTLEPQSFRCMDSLSSVRLYASSCHLFTSFPMSNLYEEF